MYNFSRWPPTIESNKDCDIVGSLSLVTRLCGVEADDDESFPKRFNSAQTLGSGAREPLAKITERHSWDISRISKPGDNRRRTR